MEDDKYKIGEKLNDSELELDARCGIATEIRKLIIERYAFVLHKFERGDKYSDKDIINGRQIKILLNFLAQLGV